MDAQAKKVSEILIAPNQYLIPFFQRQYSWQRKHWMRLWEDIVALLEDRGGSSQHFLGPLVCTPDKLVPAEIVTFQLIDGQQRLTTLMALMAAVRELAREHGQQPLVEQVTDQYLIHKYQEGHRRYRVLPRVSDREAFMAIMDEAELEPEQKKFGVFKAKRFFKKQIGAWIEKEPAERLKAVFRAVSSRMALVVITIDGENPYEIFESLNSTGLPLQESDLIRNYVFMQVPTDKQDTFNQKYWEHLETIFGEGDEPRFSATQFYRNYLMREGVFSKSKMTFVDFKEQNRQRKLTPEDQADELRRFAKLESMIRFPQECEDKQVAAALSEIAMLDVTTAHPLLLNLLDKWKQDELAKDELLDCMRDLSSFVLRRWVCGMSSRQYNRYFPEAAGSLDASPREALRRYWIRRGWPHDALFVERLLDFPMYQSDSKKTRMLLQKLEEAERHKEKISLAGLTIEHVMPQKIEGSKGVSWREELGDDWFVLHAKWVHTLGNLTLTGYNPELSNSPFEAKQKLLAESHLELNKRFTGLAQWGVEDIKQRAGELSRTILGLWPVPADAPPVQPAPPDPETTDKPLMAGKKTRLRYWARFSEVLKDSEFPLQSLDSSGSTGMNFSVGHPNVNFWARIVLKKQELKVGLSCKRRMGKKIYQALSGKREELESRLGYPLEWENKRGWVTVTKPAEDYKQTERWPEQHEWFVTHLVSIHRVLGPAIATIAESVGESSVGPGRKLEYWMGFAAHMNASNSTLKPQKPQSQHWMEMALGGVGYHLSAVCSTRNSEANSSGGEIRAEVVLTGKHSKVYFQSLYEDRDVIEAELGDVLIWHNPDNKQMCRIYYRQSVDVNDRSHWPQQYEWLRHQLDALHRVFSPRAKQINPSEYQARD